MTGQRRLRIVARLAEGERPELGTQRLCEVCAEVTGMTGAGIMLMSGVLPRGSVCTTNTVSALLEELQFSLGVGPCLDAYQNDRAVLVPDLGHPSTLRWIAFSTPAIEAGVRAVFAFPLRIGAVRLGALNLYRDRPGPLSDEEHADALVMADLAAQTVLVLQANATPGALAAELEVGADFHYVVHQASGMVAVQLKVTVGQALVRLRAHAFGNERALTDVAQDVVARRLRFDDGAGRSDAE